MHFFVACLFSSYIYLRNTDSLKKKKKRINAILMMRFIAIPFIQHKHKYTKLVKSIVLRIKLK